MNIQSLLQEVFSINEKYKNIADVTGENFNLFRLLKVEASEVRTHSAFIAELLNPQGSHGKGDAFLKCFIQIFEIHGFENFAKIDAVVKVEEVGKYGRIDIVIKPKKGRLIIIENKIYATDQVLQLIRYKKQYPNSHLLYLTLYGNEPDIISIVDSVNDNQLKSGIDFFTASYKENIIEWLHICRKEAANNPLVRETITQYINLIKHLTHQTMNEQTKAEVISSILKNPENIDAAQFIADSWSDVRFKILENLKQDILNDTEIKLEKGFSENYKVGEKNSFFWFHKADWNHCVYFEFSRDFDDLYFGIAMLDYSVEKFDLDLKRRLDERFLNCNIGNNIATGRWLWRSYFGVWDEISWKDVETVGLIEIKEMLKKIIENLNGIKL